MVFPRKIEIKVLTNPYKGFNISYIYCISFKFLKKYAFEVINLIFERLRTIIAIQFALPEESITLDTAFVDDLGADSLDVVELTMAIEEEFYIPEVDEETVTALVTVRDVVRFLSENCD